jgi:hypothetical protein
VTPKIKKGLIFVLIGWLIGTGIGAWRKHVKYEREESAEQPEWLKTQAIPADDP